jgi:alkylation response protein AidB-like acyl-CoA dehydrogenase
MNFALSDEQQMIVDTVRAFVENELYPHEREVEQSGHLDMDLVRDRPASTNLAGAESRIELAIPAIVSWPALSATMASIRPDSAAI